LDMIRVAGHGHLDLRRVEADPEKPLCAENMSRDYTDGIIGGLCGREEGDGRREEDGDPDFNAENLLGTARRRMLR
jgi:hypothetical protein